MHSPSCDSETANKQPSRSWLLIWSTTILLFCAIVTFCESAWRELGYSPSAVDSPALWTFWYDRAVSNGPQTIVLIGSSRIQAGTSTVVFRKRLPRYGVYQLAKYASGSPIGVLRKLSADDRFNGIVICGMIEPFLSKQLWDDQRTLFEYTGPTRDGVEAVASATVLSLLAIRNAEYGIFAASKELINHGELPHARHITGRQDRSMRFDFSKVDGLDRFRKTKAEVYRKRYKREPFPPPAVLDGDIREIDHFIRRIQARGGQVVFVRMPSSRDRLALEEEYHPKIKYWDRFAVMTRGIWIHMQDLPDEHAWECPDDSHLDYPDAVRFTHALVDELLKRKVVAER